MEEPREPREPLEEELSDLAGLLQTDESLDTMLGHVADIAVRAIPACDAAGVTLFEHDRVGTDEFPMTHEFLAQMLGVRRASVTVTAGALQRAGFVEFSRGRVEVVDRAGLEGAACECYAVTREVYDRLLP